jgi:serine protease AprX
MLYSKRLKLFIALLAFALTGFAQENRYMVFFKDKNGSPYNISQPLQFLSQKAINRRIVQDVTISSQDFPVNTSYVQGVKNTGASVFFKTRWMNGVLVQCPPSLIPSIEALEFVDHVEFVAPQARLISNGRKELSFRKKSGTVGFETQTQLRMIGIPEMHQDEKRGEGISIAIFDGGFQGVNTTAPFQHIFSEGRFNSALSYDFVRNTNNVFQYDDHGTEVFSVIAAYTPEVFTGGAYKADFQLYVTEEVGPEYRVEEYNWLFAAERADSAGVDIINSSLGYYDFDMASMNYTKEQMDGKTTVVTRAAQWAADRGIVVVCSAGNEGNIAWKIITAPADAEGVIAVANVTAQGVKNPSSSIGPSADGRIKPDFAALGTGVRTIVASGSLGAATGTSLSAPLITSLVAGVWQRFPFLTRKTLIEALMHTASLANNPNNELGYGIPHYQAVENYLDQRLQANVFEVYPNPVSDTLHIKPFDPEEITYCEIELMSAQGQLLARHVATFNWLNNTYPTDISHLSEGVYYVRVWLGGQWFVFKVVKV